MGGFASSRILEVHGERMIKRTFDPGFRIELHQKDLNLALHGRACARRQPAQHRHRAGAVQCLRRQRRQGLGSSAMVQGARALANHAGRPKADGPASDATPREERRLLRAMFDAAVAAARPGGGPAAASPAAAARPHHRRRRRQGRGRDGARRSRSTGRASSRAWSSRATATARRAERIEVVEAAHPVPDAAGRAAAERISSWSQGSAEDDLVLCLISGGGSALLAAAGRGLTLADKQAVNRALLELRRRPSPR